MEKREIIDKIYQARSISDYSSISSEIEKLSKDDDISTVKVAILSNFTIKGLEKCLQARSFIRDIPTKIYMGEYGQWRQEIMGKGLYSSDPQAIFIILDSFGIDNGIYFGSHALSEEDLEKNFKEYLEEIKNYISLAKKKTKAKIVISNIPDYGYNILGISETKIKCTLRKKIRQYNLLLEDVYTEDSQVFVFDYDKWLSHQGKSTVCYDKYFYMADMRINPEKMPDLAEELVAYMIPIASQTKKCLVLDLDNTLWGGVIGEDGLEGIKLSPSGEGQAYYLFQRAILGLHQRGVILAVNSKNNPEDVEEVFKKHPHMVLKKEHFAAMRINWQNKAANLKELAQEINIGVESMVFVDDDPANRHLIKENFPDTDILELPADACQYLKILLDYKGFNTFDFTEEDKNRGKMYHSESLRKEFQKQSVDIESFLKGLGIKIKIAPLSSFSLPRAAQLTQKTNQFNLTTRRYSTEDLENFLRQGAKIWTLEVNDRFGEYGVTGLIIVKNMDTCWEIDTMLLSCRVLGKKVEKQFLGYVMDRLKEENAKSISAKYIPTKKNDQVKDFYAENGFVLKSENNEGREWQMDLKKFDFKSINYILIN